MKGFLNNPKSNQGLCMECLVGQHSVRVSVESGSVRWAQEWGLRSWGWKREAGLGKQHITFPKSSLTTLGRYWGQEGPGYYTEHTQSCHFHPTPSHPPLSDSECRDRAPQIPAIPMTIPFHKSYLYRQNVEWLWETPLVHLQKLDFPWCSEDQ